jgi:hypothetical protein
MAESGAHDVCSCTYSSAELFQTENFKREKAIEEGRAASKSLH